MRINGFSGTNTQTGTMGMTQGNDSVSKNIQNQIANAQQKLQDLSSNEEMSLEDKMKKRQEIQQEINNLNQQLRQHQIEQRNKFSVGEQIEIMKPDGRNVEVTVRRIVNEDGQEQESAPHAKQTIYVDLGAEADLCDILRRKEE